MFKRLMLLTAVSIAFLASAALAGVPTSLTVQGRLTDNTGAPITTGAHLYFKIYDPENPMTLQKFFLFIQFGSEK